MELGALRRLVNAYAQVPLEDTRRVGRLATTLP
jgi:hypothetical protein